MREMLSALCHSRARGDFCQAVLLIARYQGAQCSRWHRPRHARQSATPVRHDSSATEYHNAYAVYPTVYAATYTASTGHLADGTGEDPPRSESLQGDEAYPERDSQSTVNIFFMGNYTSLLGPPVGVQRLCTRPPCTIKGGRPLENDSGRAGQRIDSFILSTPHSGCRVLRSGGPNHSKYRVFLRSCPRARSA